METKKFASTEEELFAYDAMACGLAKGIMVEIILIVDKNRNPNSVIGSFVRGQIKRSLVLDRPLYFKENGIKPVTRNIKKIFLINKATFFETNDAVYKVRFV